MGFTGLNYQYSQGISYITSVPAASYPFGASAYSRWYKNGVLLQPPTDYNIGYSQYGVNIINGFLPLNTGDVIRLEIYDTIQDRLVGGINNGNGILLDTIEDTVKPLYSYLETYFPNVNGITSSDTTDQSIIQLTPLTISKCSVTPINAHILNSIKIFSNRIDDAGSYTYGNFTINGVDLTNGDIDEQALQTGSFNFAAGVFSHNAENIVLNNFSTLTSNTVTYQHNGINTDDDFTFSINGVGFGKISSDDVLNRYVFTGDDVNTNPQFATPTSLYSIEQTPTQYILRVDGVVVKIVSRSVVYSSTIGFVSDGSMLPLGTGINYTATTSGTGYIQALIDGNIVARQNINVIDTPAPVFPAGLNSYSNTCPSSTFNLNSISVSNPQAGYTLKWYSDISLNTEITNTVLNTSQVVYASYESDVLVACNKVGVAITITINTCPVTGVVDITNSIGGLPNLEPICGTNSVYKSPIVFTPNVAVSPITYNWTVSTGFTISSGQGTDTISVLTSPGFTGTGTLTITAVTPYETLTKSINLTAICANAINHSYTATINSPITGNVSTGNIICGCVATVGFISTLVFCAQ